MYIHVAAAGNGTRMQPVIEELGLGALPKHLLPTGGVDNETLLGRNIASALETTPDVVIHANDRNVDVIRQTLGDIAVPIILDTQGHPFGPFSFVDLARPHTTQASVAGDVYIEHADWEGFLSAHERSVYPVSFLVGKVCGRPSNAVFDVDETDGKILDFRRLKHAEPHVYRNIGMYAFTLTEPVIDVMSFYKGMEPGQEDKIATDLVREGLVRAHIHPDRFFNINNRTEYDELLAFTSVSRNLTEAQATYRSAS